VKGRGIHPDKTAAGGKNGGQLADGCFPGQIKGFGPATRHHLIRAAALFR